MDKNRPRLFGLGRPHFCPPFANPLRNLYNVFKPLRKNGMTPFPKLVLFGTKSPTIFCCGLKRADCPAANPCDI
ncbi:hypothetical protein BGS_1214 [Beggiatoa sp. SS]|nr:hypothetical protein BGS_1214 [Beggiatoa sp. SS]